MRIAAEGNHSDSLASGDEYVTQFVNAVEDEVGVERNETAIRAVRAQLTGAQAE